MSGLKNIAALGALIGVLALAGCGQKEKDPDHIKVGVITGAEQQVAEVAQKVAKDKYGLDVELVSFNDYVLPNEALSKGDIDVNAFQHQPYLDQQIKDRGYKLVAVGKTFVYPLAGYSRNIKSLDQLQNGAQVAIPNDPTNLGRSLLLLQKVGLIKLKDGVGLLPTSPEEIENQKKIKRGRTGSAAAAAFTGNDEQTTLAIQQKHRQFQRDFSLNPAKEGIGGEDKEAAQVNLKVAHEENKATPRMSKNPHRALPVRRSE